MRVLSKDQIVALVDVERAATAIEDAYRAASAGEVTLPPVGHVVFPDQGADCHIKFGHRHGDPVWVIKVATGFPLNVEPVPKNNGLSLVLSAETGEVLAVLHDHGWMTDLRTGLGGAIASRALARSDAHRLLVVGTGTQAEQQIVAHTRLFAAPLDVRLWGRSRDKAQSVADRIGTDVVVVHDLESACREADLIVTTTAAREPLIDDAWIAPGTHVTAVGADAPGKHELDAALLRRADLLVADSAAQCLDHGELSAVRDQADRVVELGDVLAERAPGRSSASAITVADLTGIAAQDLAIAGVVLDAHAAQQG